MTPGHWKTTPMLHLQVSQALIPLASYSTHPFLHFRPLRPKLLFPNWLKMMAAKKKKKNAYPIFYYDPPTDWVLIKLTRVSHKHKWVTWHRWRIAKTEERRQRGLSLMGKSLIGANWGVDCHKYSFICTLPPFWVPSLLTVSMCQ